MKVKTVFLSASWRTSNNVGMNCVSRSVTSNISLAWNISILFSLATERFKILTISIMTPFIYLTLTTCKTLAEVFLYCGAGSVHVGLYGTAWTYICGCGHMLDVFNHGCYAVMTFMVQLQPSFLREICSHWQIVSLMEHFYHLFETTLLHVRQTVLYKGILS